MKIFGPEFVEQLSGRASGNERRRQHHNIHQSYLDSCQRLFNAVEPESYIRPHRHLTDSRDELLIAVRGEMALLTFDDCGEVTGTLRFGTEKHRSAHAVGAEVPANVWHTVVSLKPGSVLLEVKAGPFDPERPKDSSPWAPEEGSPEASLYLRRLIELVALY